jgi:hypothetical protein
MKTAGLRLADVEEIEATAPLLFTSEPILHVAPSSIEAA